MRATLPVTYAAALLAAVIPSAAQSQAAKPLRYKFCQTGISAEGLISGLDVYGPKEERIGETENLIVSEDGRVLALVAEVGGLWEIGDTHVSVPWRRVEVGESWVRVPIDQQRVNHYDRSADRNLVKLFESQPMGGLEGKTLGSGVFRATELLGDIVRLPNVQLAGGFGIVDDLLISKDRVKAVLIAPNLDTGLGEEFAVSFQSFKDSDFTSGRLELGAGFRENEVKNIGAFVC